MGLHLSLDAVLPDRARSSTSRWARAIAALGRAADRCSDAIVGANDTDPRCPGGRP